VGTRRLPRGRTKLDAARDAARAFLDALRLVGARADHAAVVAFNSVAALLEQSLLWCSAEHIVPPGHPDGRAWGCFAPGRPAMRYSAGRYSSMNNRLSPLTVDRVALDRALGAIAPAAQTCIVCGVDAAAAELASARHQADHAPVLILLTDGRSNPQPAAAAVARAGAAKAAGIRVYTVGLGADLDEAALREMASGAGAYHHAPTAEELAGIYRTIAVDIPCPPAAFWSQR
jgi:hypothetical protein